MYTTKTIATAANALQPTTLETTSGKSIYEIQTLIYTHLYRKIIAMTRRTGARKKPENCQNRSATAYASPLDTQVESTTLVHAPRV